MSTENIEIWKQIIGFEGVYSVSSHGRIRRDKHSNKSHAGDILKQGVNPQGYKRVELLLDGKRHAFLTHCLVALCFLGPRPEGFQVNHIDGDKGNAFIGNLEYVTPSENVRHAFRLGLRKATGVDNNFSKLSEKDVVEIRRLYSTGIYTCADLAGRFNVSKSLISQVAGNRAWKHLLDTSA